MKFSKNQWISIVGIIVAIMIPVLGWLFNSNKSSIENNKVSNSGINNGTMIGKLEVNATKERTIGDDLKKFLDTVYKDKSKSLTVI